MLYSLMLCSISSFHRYMHQSYGCHVAFSSGQFYTLSISLSPFSWPWQTDCVMLEAQTRTEGHRYTPVSPQIQLRNKRLKETHKLQQLFTRSFVITVILGMPQRGENLHMGALNCDGGNLRITLWCLEGQLEILLLQVSDIGRKHADRVSSALQVLKTYACITFLWCIGSYIKFHPRFMYKTGYISANASICLSLILNVRSRLAEICWAIFFFKLILLLSFSQYLLLPALASLGVSSKSLLWPDYIGLESNRLHLV